MTEIPALLCDDCYYIYPANLAECPKCAKADRGTTRQLPSIPRHIKDRIRHPNKTELTWVNKRVKELGLE